MNPGQQTIEPQLLSQQQSEQSQFSKSGCWVITRAMLAMKVVMKVNSRIIFLLMIQKTWEQNDEENTLESGVYIHPDLVANS